MSRAADRESYALVPETCPHVDAALAAAAEGIKEQTGALRAALTDAIDRAIDAEEKLADSEAEISRLKEEVAQLKSILVEMEAAA